MVFFCSFQCLVLFVFQWGSCRKASQWQWALQLLQSKAEAVDRISYNAAISACEKAGEWQWALLLDRQVDSQVVDCAGGFLRFGCEAL